VSQGGVPKRPVPEARVGAAGLAGDAQRWKHHGGPQRAGDPVVLLGEPAR